MSSKRPDKAAELAARMIEVLESRRGFADAANPPTLVELGEMCDGNPSHELIVKAATKKAFTDKAVVDKRDKKPDLTAEVYFKGEQPKPQERLAKRMLGMLETQRRLGGTAYPPTLRRLAEMCGTKGSDNLVRAAATHGPMGERTVVVARVGQSLMLDAPVVFKDDLEHNLATALPGLLRFALGPMVSKTKQGPIETTAFTPAEAVKRLIPDIRPRIERALAEAIQSRALPAGAGCVLIKGKPLLFLTDNGRAAAARTATVPATGDATHASHHHHAPADGHGQARAHPRDFAQSFRAAYESLDRRGGSTNRVNLADLREALSGFSREEFDTGLRTLRASGAYSVDTPEGHHGSHATDERQIGVRALRSLAEAATS